MKAHLEYEAESADELKDKMQLALDELAELTQHKYDEISHFEYFATRTDGGKEYRAYAHEGLNLYVAVVIDRS
jgi:hypothetical protein